MPQFRQLAAITFTEIVGYTALMGDDEQKAFELLRKNRQLQKPLIEQNNGRFIKELGDGVLASFNTVSDAVNTAVNVASRLQALTPIGAIWISESVQNNVSNKKNIKTKFIHANFKE